MKTKYKEPTQEQIVDFYYYLLMYRSMGYDLCEMDTDFSFYTTVLDRVSSSWPRETLPETYDYYVSHIGIKNIRNGYRQLVSSTPGDMRINKIKITICEDE